MEKFRSIWGEGEEVTQQAIYELNPGGKWLDLAAGDGRYVEQLIERADSLTLADIKPDDAKVIFSSLTEEQKAKTNVKFADVTKTLPFENEEFDGVFCTGTLHLFPQDKLKHIFSEMDRVLKPKGKLIVDFATEVTRTFNDGRVEVGDEELNYSTEESKEMLAKLLKAYDVDLQVSTYSDDVSNLEGYGYRAVGEFILVLATKAI